jgi:hypothetical protein
MTTNIKIYKCTLECNETHDRHCKAQQVLILHFPDKVKECCICKYSNPQAFCSYTEEFELSYEE